MDNSDDPGGATNFGVSIYTLRRLGLDLDHDGDIDKNDVQLLTQSHAADISVSHYFYFEEPLIAYLRHPL